MIVRRPGFRVGPSFEARFSPVGDRLITFGHRLVLWDVESRMRIASSHPFSHPSHIDFSPSGERLAVKNTSGEIVVLETCSLDVIARHDGRPWGEGSPVRFTPCGEYLVDGSWDGDLIVREALSGAVVSQERIPNGVRVVCTSSDRMTWVIDGPTGIDIRFWPFRDERHGVVQAGLLDPAVALNADSSLLAIRLWDRLEVWDIAKRNAVKVAETGGLDHGGTGLDVAWSPDGRWIAAAGDRAVRVYPADLAGVHWRAPLEYSCSAEFSPSGHLLACGAWSNGFVIATSTFSS